MLPRPPVPPVGLAPDEIDPEEALRQRLILYRIYRDASLQLGQRLDATPRLHHREAAAATGSRTGRCATGRGATVRSGSPPGRPRAQRRAGAAAASAAGDHAAIDHAGGARRRSSAPLCADAPTIVLQDLLSDVHDRVVLAVTFLALLELVKRREVVAEQAEPWGPITCRATTKAERAGVAADASAPIDESLADFA